MPKLAVLSLALAACASPALVPGASPTSTPTSGPGLGAAAERGRVVVEARAEAWPEIARWCTPILVTAVNDGPVPVRVSPQAFVLVTGGATFRALPGPWPGEMAEREIATTVVPPRSSVRGFVYFDHVSGRFGPIDLRAELVDAQSGGLYATIDVPFLLKSPPTCTRAAWSGPFGGCATL